MNWCTADTEPLEKQLPILCYTRNGKMLTFKEVRGWNRLVEKYAITHWVYQKDVEPK